MKVELRKKLNRAVNNKKQINRLVGKMKKKPLKHLDMIFHELHNEAFRKIDCLDCANCCKTTSPIFYDKDIERMAAYFRIKPVQFFNRYLKIDAEGDQVLQSSPCPFLLDDNKCKVYEARPKACREYPHTNRKRMHQILDLTAINSRVCPAVADILSKISSKTT